MRGQPFSFSFGDQYLTPELLRDHCPCGFCLEIQSWHVRDLSAPELCDFYRHLASFRPSTIVLSMTWLEEERKMAAVLEVARERGP